MLLLTCLLFAAAASAQEFKGRFPAVLYPDACIPGGDVQLGVTTLAGCEALCVATESCAAFEFTESDTSCVHHALDTVCNVKVNTSGCDHYTFKGCMSCVTTTGGLGATNQSRNCVFPFYFGGVAYTSCTRVTGTDRPWCSSSPVYEDAPVWGICANEDCTDTDVTTTTTTTTVTTPTTETTTTTMTTTTESTTTTASTPTSPTTPGTRPTEVTNPDGCRVSFVVELNRFVFNGVEQSLIADEEECVFQCLVLTTCFGVDFNTEFELCYFFTETTLMSQPVREGNFTNHYVKSFLCPAVTTPPGQTCTDTFTVTANRHSFGGREVVAAQTRESCEQTCLNNNNCTSYDYNILSDATTRCFLFFTTIQQLFPRTGVDHYTRETCQTPTITVVTERTSGPTLPGQCEDTFEETPQRLAFGGTGLPDVTTVEQCKEVCRSVSTCFSFDYDFLMTGVKCFWHDSPDSQLTLRPPMSSSANVSHFTRVNCSVTTLGPTDMSTVSSSGPSSGPSTPNTVGPSCEDTFDLIEGRGVQGGSDQFGINSLQQCQQVCLNDAECLALDYVPGGSGVRCFLHNNASQVANNRYVATGVNLYIRQTCVIATPEITVDTGVTTPCSDSFTEFVDMNSQGGQLAPGVTSVAQCQVECLSRTFDECAGFDFDTTISQCFIHTPESIANPGDSEGVNLYERNVCTGSPEPGQCDDEFELLADRKKFGGQAVSGLSTVEQCETACRDLLNCTGFDFDKVSTSLRCFIFFTDALRNLVTDENIDHYVRIQVDCIAGPGTGTPPSPCDDDGDFIEAQQVLSFGGEDHPARSEAACKTACRQRGDCVGLDFVTVETDGTRCFLHDEDSFVNRISGTQASTTNQFTKVACGQTGCQTTYLPLINVRGINGIASDAATINACQLECNDSPSCVAFGFNANTSPRCERHNDLNNVALHNLFTRENWNLLLKQITCDGQTTTTPVVTTPCVGRYEAFVNENAPFGRPFNNVTDVTQCQALCEINNNCFGLDYDPENNAPNGAKCWLHLSQPNLRSAPGVTHYRLIQRCDDITTTTTTTTTSTVSGTPEPSSEPCRDEFIETLDSKMFSGVPRPSAVSKEQCKSACSTEPLCVALDYDNSLPAGQRCFLHLDPANLNTQSRAVGVDNLVIQRICDLTDTVPPEVLCVDTYAAFDRLGTVGAAPITGVFTVADCQSLCTADVTCVGLDFNSLPSSLVRCWLHRGQPFTSNYTATGVTQYRISRCQAECVADVALIIDASGSITEEDENNWQIVRSFLATLTNTLPVSRAGIHVGVITFANRGNIQLGLNDILDRVQLARYLNSSLPRGSGGDTNTTGALRVARTQFFTAGTGDRSLVKNVVILVTDGNPTLEVAQLQAEADLLKQRAEIFAIGITSKINLTVLQQLASDPFNEHYFVVDDFVELTRALQFATRSPCFSLSSTQDPNTATTTTTTQTITDTTTTPTVTTTEFVPCQLNLVLLVDTSGSITEGGQEGNFELIKQFIITTVRSLKALQPQSRVAAITFSTTAFREFNFQTDLDLIEARVNSLYYEGGFTNTPEGLKAARELLQSDVSTSGALDMVLLLTDGRTTLNQTDLPREIVSLKNLGPRIVAVGVTDEVNRTEIEQIVTRPDYYFPVQDFNGLMDVLSDIVTSTGGCGQPAASAVCAALLVVADFTAQALQVLNPSTSEVSTLLSLDNPPLDVVLDQGARLLFWTEQVGSGSRILSVEISDTQPAVVANTQRTLTTLPSAAPSLTLDTQRGYVLVSVSGSGLIRIDYSGFNQRTVVSGGAWTVYGLDIDVPNSLTYWIEFSTSNIYRVDHRVLDQVLPSPLISPGISGGTALALDTTGRRIYWLTQNSGLYTAPLDGPYDTFERLQTGDFSTFGRTFDMVFCDGVLFFNDGSASRSFEVVIDQPSVTPISQQGALQSPRGIATLR